MCTVELSSSLHGLPSLSPRCYIAPSLKIPPIHHQMIHHSLSILWVHRLILRRCLCNWPQYGHHVCWTQGSLVVPRTDAKCGHGLASGLAFHWSQSQMYNLCTQKSCLMFVTALSLMAIVCLGAFRGSHWHAENHWVVCLSIINFMIDPLKCSRICKDAV